MFNFSEPTGFAAVVKQAHRITASGYPVTLLKTLGKLPESIKVSGANGGVGDRTANLFDELTAKRANGKRYSSTGSLTSNTHQTTIRKFPMSAKQITISFDSDISNTRFSICEFDANGDVSKYTNALSSPRTITLQTATIEIGITFYTQSDVSNVKNTNISNIMITEGSTGVSYEPYGYRIPILLSDGTTNKTINLYSDAPVILGDDVRVYPKTKKAYRGTTDISSLQDWTQDWKIPKADSLTVSAGTEVEPGSMEIAYYGKK